MSLDSSWMDSITKSYISTMASNIYQGNSLWKYYGMDTYESFDPHTIDQKVIGDIFEPYAALSFKRQRGAGDGSFKIELSTPSLTNGRVRPIPKMVVSVDNTKIHLECEGSDQEYDYDLHDPISIERIQITVEFWVAEFERKCKIWGKGAIKCNI